MKQRTETTRSEDVGSRNDGHDAEDDNWTSSDEEDVIGLQEAESIYATSPHNPEQRRRKRWRRTLALLILASSLERCVVLIAVSSESLAALSITGDPSISTIPATTRQIGAALAAAPASLLMGKVGRRYGFMAGGLLGLIGGVVSALALQLHSFTLLCVGTMAIGMDAAFGGYARYAAVEIVPQEQQPRAISLTVSSAVLSAVVGPRLAQYSNSWLEAQFAATYLLAAAVAALFISLTAINSGLPGQSRPKHDTVISRRLDTLQDPPQTLTGLCAGHGDDSSGSGFLGAVLAQASGYFMMVFVMTSTPLAMTARGIDYSIIASTISLHAVGMFLPGLVTGDLIKRTSCSHIMTGISGSVAATTAIIGFCVLLCIAPLHYLLSLALQFSHVKCWCKRNVSGVVCYVTTILIALNGESPMHFLIALLSVGLGWNFLYTSGSAMVCSLHTWLRPLQTFCLPPQSHTHSSQACAALISMVSCYCVVQLVKSVPQRDRPKAQALAETIQQISNTCASVGSGIVTGNFGWSGVAVTSIVPMMMCIVATVLTCYAEHRQRSTQDNGSGKNGRSSVRRTSHSQYVSLKTAEEDVDENSCDTLRTIAEQRRGQSPAA